MLGLPHNQNWLADYDPMWPIAFEEERIRLSDALTGVVHQIEHYGSTSIPGMRAKPILDIMIGLADLAQWSLCKTPLEAIGYDYAAHGGVPGHFIFGRGRSTQDRTHLVHLVQHNGESWVSSLAFRDRLRQDVGFRELYLACKEAAATACPEGRSRYNQHKSDFFSQDQH